MTQRTARGDALAVDLGVDRPQGWTAEQYAEHLALLARHARTHGRLSEEECNGPPFAHYDRGDIPPERYERWQADLERRTARCEARIKALVAELEGWRVAFEGDPRGFTVRLFPPSGRYNTWGGSESGWGV